ncbi:MAG TPA: peptide chain release factor N(5)-glutamine methyltransferase [Usitatibacteraceae bacterium]|nr:peptide chain release factor N(5)-glutamine methyltransferase [Usitatibacteraceae bacterium]
MTRTLRVALEESAEQVGAVDARVLACHLLDVGRAWLAANPMHVLTESQDARLDLLVAQRALGQPVAYLVGSREFYGRDFEVGPAVLIPRPETETLVEAALERMPPGGAVLDLGTGSGAIAVTLACERPQATVHATDASADSLAVARANAARHGARVEFALGSWYAPVAGRQFDLVVANPPYVAAGDHHLAEGDLRFEPRGALTDGSADGVDSIRAIVSGAPGHLKSGGWLLIEHGYDQAAIVRALLEGAGLAGLVSIPDLSGIPRVAGGRRQ